MSTKINKKYTTVLSNGYVHPFVRITKRLFDIAIAFSGIVFLLPLVPLLAIAIKFDSKGPIFYSQSRVGLVKKGVRLQFRIFKFRTMCADAESDGVVRLASIGDPRITKVGAFLRKTRLDETPQLVNVLLGQMSFIGPRPERPQLTEEIDVKLPFFAERTYGVLPGLTGLAQTNQSYQDSVNNLDGKLAYDHAYSLALSQPFLWLITDLKILFSTVVTVIKCNG